jgi:osmotically-inducible protein OsmY
MGAAAGAGLAYFLDPDRGKGRRAKARDMMAARLGKGSRDLDRTRRYAKGWTAGAMHRVTHPGVEQPIVDDQTLKARVESELFGPDFPKGSVVVDVADGVVTLRGEVGRPDEIKRIEAEAAEVPGVAGVVNLLQVPGQPAPNVTDALEASRRAADSGLKQQRSAG